jgi:hypothetical protein
MTREQSRRYYSARYRRVIAAARASIPYPTIAERFGITRSRVSQICTRAGVYRKRKPRTQE